MAGNNERIAPKGKFRVLAVDTFEGPYEDFMLGDCADEATAFALADAHGKAMQPCYVYDEFGKCLHMAGKP